MCTDKRCTCVFTHNVIGTCVRVYRTPLSSCVNRHYNHNIYACLGDTITDVRVFGPVLLYNICFMFSFGHANNAR